MLYTIPDYYKEFHCTADKCEDTCCAGWQIVIDEKTLAKYKRERGDFFWKLFRNVDWLQGTFHQDKEKRCAFLNENNLCDLYLAKGEQGFCKTCRNYPRHIEEFEGVREITLSVSCPEVARILMEKKEPVKFLTYEKAGEEEYDDFDPFLFSILEDARAAMIKILQKRSLPIKERVLLVYGMAHDMQGRINRQEMFDCANVIEKYSSENAKKFAEEYFRQEENESQRIVAVVRLFEKLYELEVLREEWSLLLNETELLLYTKGENCYRQICKEFNLWKEANPEVDIHLEQLLVYFIFTYFPGAVYDGEVFAKVQMAVYCVWMMEELWMARWLRNGKVLEREEMTELVYRFSREVEHSDGNLEKVEKMMRKKWMKKYCVQD